MLINTWLDWTILYLFIGLINTFGLCYKRPDIEISIEDWRDVLGFILFVICWPWIVFHSMINVIHSSIN